MKVLIDPGHGGKDSGAFSAGVAEENIVLEFAAMLGHFLREQGVKTSFTRTDDRFIEVMDRADTISEGDVLISCHVNSAANSSANGVSVWYHGGQADSKDLASSVLTAILSTGFLRKYNAGVIADTTRYPKGGFGVLREATERRAAGAVLVELGFICNPSDRRVMTDSRKRNLMAMASAKAITDWITSR
jgi:N-acetylmuramoyl-L-alanine amidase